MHTRLFLVLAGALLLLRLPAVVQPMGADQGLYAYVGDRILAGDLPYRDAWDQKPPAIHYTYALMRAVWPGDAAVGAADLLAAAAVAWLLFRLGAEVGPAASGPAGALLFLLLSNPSFTRLGGIRLRAQCETFIAVAVTGAFLLLARRRRGPAGAAGPGRFGGDGGLVADGAWSSAVDPVGSRVASARIGSLGLRQASPARWETIAAGALFGLSSLFKYNAGIYAAAGIVALWLWRRLTWQDVARIAAGFVAPLMVALLIFAAGGALRDLYDATITYNVRYSGETYAGPADVVRYLAAFPIQRARADALWTLGGAGCLVLLAASLSARERLVPVVWVAAACISIAVNGSRGLPQYFVQANPLLALAAGWGAVETWRALRRGIPRFAPALGALALLVVSIAVWRVNQFPKLVEQTLFDARYALGAIPRADYLARYVDDRKYSALAASRLAEAIGRVTDPSDAIYVFGFTCAAYVDADRVSASRFFWSRPVIVGFLEGRPGYGVAGLLADLERRPPRLVALQRQDWPDTADSAAFFMRTPALAGWLEGHYQRVAGPEEFDVWVRRTGGS
jgi:hypothetical protein